MPTRTPPQEPAAAAKEPRTTAWKTRRAVIVGCIAAGIAAPSLTAIGTAISNQGTVLLSEITQAKFDPESPFNIEARPHSIGGWEFATDEVVAANSPEGADLLSYDLPPSAVPIGASRGVFFITGNIGEEVTITAIRPFAVELSAPLAGTYIDMPTGGQGGTTNRTIVFDLLTAEAFTADGEPFFADDELSITLATRLLLTLRVNDAPEGTARWLYAIDVVSPDGEFVTVYLDAKGNIRPDADQIADEDRFAITSPVPTYGAVYAGDESNVLAYHSGVTSPPYP
ncbi:hypothetical protein PYV02_15220 [Leifsonia sp. H3M29-4]|uniref:hypothetical protein n=1 Tax=Salinibacterium metalliresistens TaxID=3031321 RepID=UPI0023DA8A4A|nr:hypothetical protein [Salinibacterium metalliresistens]MDF1480431.1 hypothetical protein [Salinibacterium metalliresistens]